MIVEGPVFAGNRVIATPCPRRGRLCANDRQCKCGTRMPLDDPNCAGTSDDGMASVLSTGHVRYEGSPTRKTDGLAAVFAP